MSKKYGKKELNDNELGKVVGGLDKSPHAGDVLKAKKGIVLAEAFEIPLNLAEGVIVAEAKRVNLAINKGERIDLVGDTSFEKR